jgi:hypothetical protein
MADEFKLIQLIRLVVDEINRLIETARPRLYDADQLQSSAESIGRNTREAFGRRVGRNGTSTSAWRAGPLRKQTNHFVKTLPPGASDALSITACTID